LAYGDSLPAETRELGDVPVFGSNGQVGTHSRANTHGPVVVIGRKGSYGKVQFSERPVFAIDTTYFVDETLTSHNLRWLYYALQTLDLDKLSQDVGVPGLSREAAYRTRVPLLPPEEQDAIAQFLDAELARVDELAAVNRSTARLLHERFATLNDQLIRDPEGNPTMVPLMHLVDSARPVMYGILMPGPRVSDGISVVDAGDVEAGRLDPDLLRRTTPAIEQPYIRSRLRPGDLVMSIRGSFGSVAEVPETLVGSNVSRDVARIAPAAGVRKRWLLHALRSPFVAGQLAADVMGSAVRGINIRSLKRIRIPVPPVEQQDAIATRLDRAHHDTQTLAENLDRQLMLLQERRLRLIFDRAGAGSSSEPEGVVA
jgi:type I restriction enzyme S subunit